LYHANGTTLLLTQVESEVKDPDNEQKCRSECQALMATSQRTMSLIAKVRGASLSRSTASRSHCSARCYSVEPNLMAVGKIRRQDTWPFQLV
jgi:hypothetical protein